MSRSASAVTAATTRLRGLQSRLRELTVPELLRVRDELDRLLQAERIHARDVDSLLGAQDGDR